MNNIQQFVDLVGQGDNVQAQETLNNILSNKAFEALEFIKKDIAANLFAEEAEELEEDAEQLDELSNTTLGNYVQKAKSDILAAKGEKSAARAERSSIKKFGSDNFRDRLNYKAQGEKHKEASTREKKRTAGIETAVNKMEK